MIFLIFKWLWVALIVYLVVGLPIAIQILLTALEIPDRVMELLWTKAPETKGKISFQTMATLIFFLAWVMWPGVLLTKHPAE